MLNDFVSQLQPTMSNNKTRIDLRGSLLILICQIQRGPNGPLGERFYALRGRFCDLPYFGGDFSFQGGDFSR